MGQNNNLRVLLAFSRPNDVSFSRVRGGLCCGILARGSLAGLVGSWWGNLQRMVSENEPLEKEIESFPGSMVTFVGAYPKPLNVWCQSYPVL